MLCVLAAGAHGRGHLVRVHRAFGEAREHGEGERVPRDGQVRALYLTNTRSRVYGDEYRCNPGKWRVRTLWRRVQLGAEMRPASAVPAPVQLRRRATAHAPARHLTWGCVASISDVRGGGSEPTSPERR